MYQIRVTPHTSGIAPSLTLVTMAQSQTRAQGMIDLGTDTEAIKVGQSEKATTWHGVDVVK